MIINIPPHGKCIECAHWKSGKERNRPFNGCELYDIEDPEYSGEMCDEFEASPKKKTDILRREPPTKWLIRYYPVEPHQHLKVYNLEPLDIPDYDFADVQDTIRARLDEYEFALKMGHHKKEGSSIVGFNNCWIAVIEAYHAWEATNKFFEQLLNWKKEKKEEE